MIYDNTSCGDFGKRYEIDLFITESKKPVYHFEFNNMDKVEEDEDEYLKVYKEVLTEDLWNSLIYNEEINNYFEKDKTYHELIEEPEFGAPVYLLPMYNNTEDYYSDIIENNLFHFKKIYEKESDFPISALLINNEEFDDDTSKENFIGALKDNNEVVLVKIEDFKDGNLLVNLALEEDIDFNKPFLEFQTENNQIKDIRYFENIREVTEDTINELSFFNKDEFKDLPEVLELGKTNAEFLLGRGFLNDLKDELEIELYRNNDNSFISIENMNNTLNKVIEKTEIPAISEEKVEKIKEDFIKKIENQQTINEDGYKGYDLDSLKLNFRISDEVGLKYRSVDELQKENEIKTKEKEKEKEIDY